MEVNRFLLSVIVPCGSELFPVEKINLRKIEQSPMEVKLFPVVIEHFTEKNVTVYRTVEGETSLLWKFNCSL